MKKDERVSKLAHAVNNHLAVISGYTQLLRKNFSAESPESKWIDIIEKESKKIEEDIEKFRNTKH